jgi:hypothetical protein
VARKILRGGFFFSGDPHIYPHFIANFYPRSEKNLNGCGEIMKQPYPDISRNL